MQSLSSRTSSTRPRLDGNNANRRMFASIQSTIRSGRDSKSAAAASSRIEREPRRKEYTPLVLKSVDEIIAQLTDSGKRGEHSTDQIKQNLEASSSTLAEMWDEEWAKLVEVLVKMCLVSDEAVFVVELLPICMKYADFLEAFRERMIAVASAFVLGEQAGGERRQEQVPAFLGSMLCARWPRGMHRDTLESNPILFTAIEIVRGWILVVQDSNEGGAKKSEETTELLNRCSSALAALCESQQRSLWLSRPELVDDMYKCFKRAITHNLEIDGDIKCSLLHSYMLMTEWTRSKAVTSKCSTTQTASR
ncbi:hypothetical protein PRIPAC_93581 [Pristionchus pacificus]|uniref:DUF7627 domain-containing protein n=1 Tax=Pristionchus pacificus TaxID=54126 RepID=A0A2A6BPL1_PRIPA|nr:hypothetical protein PRIPAC_93581 [Pristionchus pacificus]|eukprot:PDM67840.1 hypothetical protein PRIPAC_45884 [Pristionchus pacificus]